MLARITLLKLLHLDKKVVFSKLEELTFRRDEIKWLLSGSQFPSQPEVFPNLHCVEVYKDDSASAFALAIVERFHFMEKLKLNTTAHEEIFSSQDLEKYAKFFAQIIRLSLNGLHHLKYMWKQDSTLQCNIEILRVKSCGSLETLMPPSSSFRNLIELKVEGCDALINLFNSIVAESLENLDRLTIRNCNMMREVLSSHEEVARDVEIIFNKLKFVELHKLSNLLSFCSQNYTISLPSLHFFTLNKCPKLKFFSPGVLNTPELCGIHYNGTELVSYDNLNAAIQEIHENQLNLSQNVGTSSQDLRGPCSLPSTL